MLIAGAKGFAKELIDVILEQNPGEFVAFFDDLSNDLPDKLFSRFDILRSKDEVRDFFIAGNSFVLGVGNPRSREKLFDLLTSCGGTSPAIISKNSFIGAHENFFSEGVIIMPLSVIESSNTIGRGTLIHTGAFISHDITVGEFCEISPYVKLLGNVSIGNRCSIGTGAIILPKIKIADNAIVGAGAVVTRDIQEGECVAGVPAKPVSST